MHKEDVERLLERYNADLVTEDERAWVESWYLAYKGIEKKLSDDQLIEDQQQSINELLKQIRGGKSIRLWPRMVAVAACVLIGIGTYLYVNDFRFNKSINVAYANDIAPGCNIAVLTLANGETINLSDAKKAIVMDTRQLTYDDGASVIHKSSDLQSEDQPGLMNTITTPRGGTYQVVLPDGTKVWLNAASSLKFPSNFKGSKYRKVELIGEAYFDVAKVNANGPKVPGKVMLPFIVKTEKQEVEVFGTQFNINSYNDESMTKTTLFEGSVKVSMIRASPNSANVENHGNFVLLKPGQHVILQHELLKVADADMESDLDWKNGDLNLKAEDFKATMRKIARWYNVDIVYDSSAPTDLKLGGWVSRSKPISAVLREIELTGRVHFKIEERRITVTK